MEKKDELIEWYEIHILSLKNEVNRLNIEILKIKNSVLEIKCTDKKVLDPAFDKPISDLIKNYEVII
jgi:hypothetical protein